MMTPICPRLLNLINYFVLLRFRVRAPEDLSAIEVILLLLLLYCPKSPPLVLVIYSDLHSAILPTPSTPSTRGQWGWLRPRGGPRTRWGDVLAKDLKQLGTTLAGASNIAIDRIRWRSTIVARAVSTPSWQEP